MLIRGLAPALPRAHPPPPARPPSPAQPCAPQRRVRWHWHWHWHWHWRQRRGAHLGPRDSTRWCLARTAGAANWSIYNLVVLGVHGRRGELVYNLGAGDGSEVAGLSNDQLAAATRHFKASNTAGTKPPPRGCQGAGGRQRNRVLLCGIGTLRPGAHHARSSLRIRRTPPPPRCHRAAIRKLTAHAATHTHTHTHTHARAPRRQCSRRWGRR